MQAHGFEQHLVAVGGAVEGASAGGVVGRLLGLQQFAPAHQALRSLLAHLGLGVVGQAAGHGPCRHKHGGQVPEMQRTDQQARHDLVAHAQHQRGVEHVVAQRDGRGHGDGVAAEQAQLHAWGALGDTVAHGGHPAGDLGRGAKAAGLVLDDVGVMRQRLVGRQHVVVGVDDADVGRLFGHDAQAVVARDGSQRMCDVGATHTIGAGGAVQVAVEHCQIRLPGRCAALLDAPGQLRDYRVKFHGEVIV